MKDINNQIEPQAAGPMTSREGEKGTDLNKYKDGGSAFWNMDMPWITIHHIKTKPPEDND
jgi:hypothetical protein